MDPLSAFLFSLLCSAAYDGIKASLKSRFPEHITDRISKAFDNALEKWTLNEELRESEKKTLADKLVILKGQIDKTTDPQYIDEDARNLLDSFRVELMNDSIAYHFLEELHWDKTDNDLARLIQTTQEILAYIKPQKVKFYVEFPFNHFIAKITSNQYHIPRRIQKASECVELSGNSDLISLIEENQITNTVVLASAGMGKTEELKQTAITLANRESKYPIFVSFSNFTADKDIVDYLPETWVNIPHEKLVLLFDGFDELIDNQINIIQRKLILFIENHPKITIIVACRTNFYHLAINGNSETLTGFAAYYLQALTYEDVVDYVSAHHDIDGTLFMNAAYQKQFEDLVYNPFFLQILIPDFKQNNTFSGNRIEIFQKFIKERLSWDKEHFATSFNLNDEEEKALELLRKVSIAMEMLGSRNMESKDLHTLISDKHDFNLIKRCTVFNKEEGYEHWKFEHNNFQEILCAEMLANLPFEIVIDLISFKEYNKIQPSWTNTVSFLISLLNENDILFQPLVDWIISNDPEILIKVEKERIPLKIRTEIFIQIFNYYKDLNIWINSNKFSYSDLAHFGQSDIIIEFIINEALNHNNSRRIRLNAINILSNFQIEDLQIKNLVESKLLILLQGESLDSEFIYAVIIAMQELGYTSKETIDKLIILYLKRDSRYIRAAMYSIINSSKLIDIYVGYYISGLEIYLNKYTISEDRESTSLFDENYNLFEGIFNLNTIKAISKFIDYYLQNYSKIEGEFEFEERFDKLIYNCISLYKYDKTIFDYMFKVLAHESYHSWITNKKLKTLLFFKGTNTKKEATIKTLKLLSSDSENIYDHIRLLCRLVDEDNIVIIFEAFSKEIITEAHLVCICKHFHNSNHPLSEALRLEICKNTTIIVELPIQIDYDKIRKERAQRSFDILFDVELFKNECLRVFEHREELHVSELYDHVINKNLDFDIFYPASALNKLRDFKDENGVVLKSKILNWFESYPNVTNYIVPRIYGLLKSNTGDLILSDIQIVYIKNWFSNTVTTIDFSKAIERGSGNSFTTNWHAIYCVFFMQKLSFDCPENILLDMLSFTFNDSHISQEYIEKMVDKQKVEQRIISNIKNKTLQNDTVYENHVEYIFQNQLLEVYPNIFDDLSNNLFDEYHQKSIIDVYFKYNQDTDLLKSFFDMLNINTQIAIFKWFVKNEDLKYSFDKLMRLHELDLNKEQEKDVNNLLISCKSIKGLEFSIRWINRHMQSPFSQHGQSLAYFDKLDSLPYFMELLELGYNKDVKIGNELDGMLSIVLDGIYNLAIQSDENFNEVCSKLKEFIEVNKGRLEEVEFLNATIERIKERFFQTHSVKYNIKQIKQHLNSISL